MPAVIPATLPLWASLLISVGVSATLYVLTPKPKKFASNLQDDLRTERDPISPYRMVYGTTRVGGTVVAALNSAEGAGTVNTNLHLIVVLACHKVQSISKLWLHGHTGRYKELAFDGSGNCTTTGYIGKIWMHTKLGATDQTALTITELGTRWTSNHRLRGLAYVHIKLQSDNEVFPDGVPNMTWEVQGKNDIFDPRTDTTGYSHNAALCLADYIACEWGMNSGRTGTAYNEIHDSILVTAANACDEDVNGRVRYRCDGTLTLDAPRRELLAQLLSAMAGTLVFSGGKWKIYAGKWRAPTLTLTEADLRGDLKVQTRLGRRELFNSVRGTYVSEENGWIVTDYPPVRNATYQAEDGEELVRDTDYTMTTNHIDVQRLAKIELEKVRQQIRVTASFSMKAYQLEAPDVVNLTMANEGWSAKPFEVTDSYLETRNGDSGPEVVVNLVLRETASGIYDWNNGEETTIDLSADTDLPDPFIMSVPTGLTLTCDSTTAIEIQDGIVVPAILVEWTAPVDANLWGYELQWKRAADTEYQEVRLNEAQTEYTIPLLTKGITYNVRIRAISRFQGVRSAWVSDSIVVSTRDGLITARVFPGHRIGRNPFNFLYDGDFNIESAWGLTAAASETATNPNSDADVSGYTGFGADRGNIRDNNESTEAKGTASVTSGVATNCALEVGFATATKRGYVLVKTPKSYSQWVRAEGWYKIGTGSWTFFGSMGSMGWFGAIQSSDLGSLDLSTLLVRLQSFAQTAGRGVPTTYTGDIGAVEIYFMAPTPPYAQVGDNWLTLIGDGTNYAEAKRPLPGEQPDSNQRAVFGEDLDYVQLIALKRGEAGQALDNPVEIHLIDNDGGTSEQIMSVAAADVIDDWRYFAILWNPTTTYQGNLEWRVRTKSSKSVHADRACLVRGDEIVGFVPSVDEFRNGYFGDERTPPPIVGDLTDWSTGVYKKFET